MHILSLVFFIFSISVVVQVNATPRTYSSKGQKKAALIELYTSEGCSSCPPAEKYIYSWKTNNKKKSLFKTVFPLVFHVNYWDYLGWKDRLANKKHTKRQRVLASLNGSGTIYTPGLYKNARKWKTWSKRLVIDKVSLDPMFGRLEVVVERRAKNKSIHMKYYSEQNSILEFHTALLGFDVSTKVSAGERAGEILQHQFSVISYDKVKVKSIAGKSSAKFKLKSSVEGVKSWAFVAWVTSEKQSPLQIVGGYLGTPP